MIIIWDPALVLLDRPADSIRPSIIDEIVGKLHRLRARCGLTIQLVEQSVGFIQKMSDRMVTQKGRFMVKQGVADVAH